MIRDSELVITVSKDKYKNIAQVEKIDYSSTC